MSIGQLVCWLVGQLVGLSVCLSEHATYGDWPFFSFVLIVNLSLFKYATLANLHLFFFFLSFFSLFFLYSQLYSCILVFLVNFKSTTWLTLSFFLYRFNCTTLQHPSFFLVFSLISYLILNPQFRQAHLFSLSLIYSFIHIVIHFLSFIHSIIYHKITFIHSFIHSAEISNTKDKFI